MCCVEQLDAEVEFVVRDHKGNLQADLHLTLQKKGYTKKAAAHLRKGQRYIERQARAQTPSRVTLPCLNPGFNSYLLCDFGQVI